MGGALTSPTLEASATPHPSHIFCDSPKTAVSIRDAYLVQRKYTYTSKSARLSENVHQLLRRKREEYFVEKDDDSPHVTAVRLFELKDEQYMTKKGQKRKRLALSILTEFDRDKFVKDTVFYVCGRGARVMLRSDTTVRCGTVIDLKCDMTRSKYAIRIDNTDEIETLDLRPYNALPASTYQYTAGQRLMILDGSSTSDKQNWVDATVVNSRGKQHGSRHRIRAELSGKEMEFDLNRFNHAVQAFETVGHFFALRTEYFDHLRETERTVIDAITGNSLDVKNQTVNISVSNIAGKHISGYSDAANMHGLADQLCSTATLRSSGQYKAQPVLIQAGAGTGKSWGTQQLQFAMSEIASFDGLPLLIPSQSLVSLAANRQNSESANGRDLLVSFINDKYKARPDWCRMLTQSLRLNAVVIIFDGVDEAPQLKEGIQRLFTEDLVPKRVRFLLTSRPDGIDQLRFEHSFVILDLNPLNDDQVQLALDQQMLGNTFFDHLFEFRKLRTDQDELFYNKLAPKASTRRLIQNLGDGLDLFKKLDGSGQYNPKMRQRRLAGDRFVAVNKTATYRSQTVLNATAILSDSLFSKFDQLVAGSAEAAELEMAVRQLSPELFGPSNNERGVKQHHIRMSKTSKALGPTQLLPGSKVEGNYGGKGHWFPATIQAVHRDDGAPTTYDLQYDKCLPQQKSLFRIAKRLVFYTRRCKLEPTSLEPTATKEMWHKIAAYTDELLELAEALQEPLKAAIREAAGPKRQQSVSFGPLKDPVRIYEKSFDDYDSRFKDVDGIIPIACIVDVLRCSVVGHRVEDLIEILTRMQSNVTISLDNKQYTLRLVRVKNKFSRQHSDASHYRNILINVQLCRDGSDVAVFAEVQLKIQSVSNLLKVHDSHTHYEYFRSLFRGNVEVVDLMIQQLFDFIEKVCSVPVLMSLLITVMRDYTTSKDEKQTVIMPVNKLQLYDLAIAVVLRRWNPSRAGLARTVLARIAQHMVLVHNSDRIFTAAHVERALQADEERECWTEIISSAGGNEAALPLIKVLEHADSQGQYQFKHLSFQEYLAADEIAHNFQSGNSNDRERTITRSWFEVQGLLNDLGDGVQANFYEFVVAFYQAEGKHFAIDASDMRRSCIITSRPSCVQNRNLLRALVTQSVFPSVGNINLDGCTWITDDDLLTWTIRGSDVETLSLRGCTKITNAGLARLAAVCLDVKTVILSGCANITSVGIKDLSSCNGLTSVDLTGCEQLTDNGIKALTTTCTDMVSINLNGCVKITNKCLERLNAWKQLQSVGLARCSKVSANRIVKMLNNCPSIASLDLSHLAIDDALLNKLPGHTLGSLTVSGCEKVTAGKGLMPFLKKAKALTSVGLADCPAATGRVLSQLLKVSTQLTSVDVGGTETKRTYKPSVLAKLAQQPGLTSLRLRGCGGLTDDVLEQVAGGCSRLTMVDLENCGKDVTDVGLASLVIACPKLQPGNTLSTAKGDNYLTALGEHHQDLEEIDLQKCTAVTDKGLAALAKGCPKLHPDRTLSDAKGDAYLTALGKHRQDLQEIDLEYCAAVTDDGLAALAKGCPKLHPGSTLSKAKGNAYLTALEQHHQDLEEIDLLYCTAVTDEGLAVLATNCPKLHPDRTLSHAKGDAYLTALGKHRQDLEQIDLRQDTAVTDKGLVALAKGCLKLHPNNTLSKAKGNAYLTALGQYHQDLKEIDLRECPAVTDDGLAALAKGCPKLHPNSTLSKAKGDAYLTALGQYHQDLKEIDLRECITVTDDGLAALATGCPKLHPESTLSKAKGDAYLAALGKHHRDFEDIDLRECPAVTDDGLAALAKGCPKLHPDRTLSQVKGDAYLSALGQHHKGLEEINLDTCAGVTDKGLAALAKGCPKLHPDRTLSHVKGDAYLTALGQHQQSLEKIDLQDCTAVTGKGLVALATGCPKLHPDCTLSSVKNDAYLTALSQHHKGLKDINLQGCTAVTGNGLAALATGCPKLHPDRTLSYVKNDAYLTAVGQHHKDLKDINLRECAEVTDDGLAALAKGCPKLQPNNTLSKAKGDAYLTALGQHHKDLKKIDLRECDAVTDNGLAALAKECVKLHPNNTLSKAKGDAYLTALGQHHKDLEQIDLRECTAVTDVGLAALEELDLLELTCNQMSSSNVMVIAECCPRLTSLNLTDCTISDWSLTAIAENCSGLTSLNLNGCGKITDSSVTAIAENCTELTSLNLKSCGKITDDSVAAIGEHCSGLISLNLERCYIITDRSVTAVAKNCPGLTSLNLKKCDKIADWGVITVAKNCSELKSLNLNNCGREISDWSVKTVAEHCAKLTSLDVNGCARITNSSVTAIVEHCPGLTSLDLSRCYKITDPSVTAAAQHCPVLNSLNLDGCEEITDSSLMALAKRCKWLTSLNLNGCGDITDASVKTVATHCAGLVSLYLKGCDKTTDSSVIMVAKHCPGLTSLNVIDCCKMTDSSVTAIATHCTGLTSLELKGCVEVTDSSVTAIAKHCARLTSLNLTGCVEITDSSVVAVAEQCPGLTSLSVGGCNITDLTVMVVAKHCAGLNSLSLSDCDKVSNSSASVIAEHCSQLTSLNLSGCRQITAPSVAAIAKHCPGLTLLDLSDCNKITDLGIKAIAKHCPGLTLLNLNGCNKITDLGVTPVAHNCQGLTSLDFTGCNKITNSSVSAVADHCPRLTSLNLNDCIQITNPGVTAIANHCPGLTFLNLNDCDKITDSSVTAIAEHCPGLTSMNLKMCDKITDSSLSALATYAKGLTSLNLKGCGKITDSSLEGIANNCPGLISLNLNGTANRHGQITDSSITKIAKHCPRLTSLNLNGCNRITDSSVTAVGRRCARLTSLNLANCYRITELTPVAVHCSGLTFLDLSGCDQLSDSSVSAIAKHCSGLTSLNLKGCEKITNSSLTTVATQCPGLTALDLNGCSGITDSSVMAVAENCPGLTSLNLCRCIHITDASLTAVAEHCPGLTSLNLKGCEEITDASMAALADDCQGLTSLNLKGCPKITDSSVADIVDHCPGLNSLSRKSITLIRDSNQK